MIDSVDLVAELAAVTTTGGRLNVRRMIDNCPVPKVTSLALTPSAPSPQPPGTVVTWTAAPSGGQAPFQYQWLTYDGRAWTQSAWGHGNTLAWQPMTASTAYQVAVRVRSAWNSGTRDAAAIATYVVMPMVTSLTLTPSLPSPQGAGTSVAWTATAAGGQAPYQYQWLVYDGTAWTQSAWGPNGTLAWTPVLASEEHQVAVRVRSAWNSGPRELSAVRTYVVLPRVTNLALTPSVLSPQPPGTVVTWTATPTGGQVPYQYQWLTYDGRAWTQSAWGNGNTLVWQPMAASTAYQVAVRVRSAWNTGTRDEAAIETYVVMPMVTSLTLMPNVASPQAVGTRVTWTATAAGGQAPYQYQWLTYDGAAWTQRAWGTSRTLDWTPAQVCEACQVAVRVRSAWNTGVREQAVIQNYTIQ